MYHCWIIVLLNLKSVFLWVNWSQLTESVQRWMAYQRKPLKKFWIFITKIVVSYELMVMKLFYFLSFKGKINMANQWKLGQIISIKTKDFSFNTEVHVLKFKVVSHWPYLLFSPCLSFWLSPYTNCQHNGLGRAVSSKTAWQVEHRVKQKRCTLSERSRLVFNSG